MSHQSRFHQGSSAFGCWLWEKGIELRLKMVNRLHKIVPVQYELVPFILMVFMVWYIAINFSRLPETIPTHFNFQGTADGFGGKSGIIVSAGLGVFCYLLITVVSILLVLVRDPKSMINLPAAIKARITPEQAEVLRIFLVRCLFALKLLIAAMNTFLVYGNIETAFSRWPGLGYWPMVFVVFILALAFLMVYRSMRMGFSK
jgi:uncharacterized membrane protein